MNSLHFLGAKSKYLYTHSLLSKTKLLLHPRVWNLRTWILCIASIGKIAPDAIHWIRKHGSRCSQKLEAAHEVTALLGLWKSERLKTRHAEFISCAKMQRSVWRGPGEVSVRFCSVRARRGFNEFRMGINKRGSSCSWALDASSPFSKNMFPLHLEISVIAQGFIGLLGMNLDFAAKEFVVCWQPCSRCSQETHITANVFTTLRWMKSVTPDTNSRDSKPLLWLQPII